MSGTTAVMPPRPKTSAPSLAWRVNFYRVRGWESNSVKNQGLKGTLDAVLKPGGPESAAALASEKLEAGAEFKAYLQCLAAFERTPDAAATTALDAAARGYLAHFDKHSEREKKQKTTQRKAQLCQKTLVELSHRPEIDSIGGLPWNSKTAMKAATIKAELDFASLPMGAQSAEALDGKGVNASYWVNRASAGPAKPAKTYLFKPALDKSDRPGVPSGGEPAREALTGRAADILSGMTGIDFKVPETHIVKVERSRLGKRLPDELVDRNGTGPLVGSLQQFAPSKGELRDNSPTLARAVPPQRCQELAILDVVTMNMDRHGGNFMVDGTEASADLIPIDNGLSFPDQSTGLSHMAAAHNALLRLPGSHKPFTAETLAKIQKINPVALKLALQSEIGDIEAVHPTSAGKVAAPALEQSRRAAMFLKLAAPTLTPAMVQVALGQNAERLFDTVAITTDAAFAALAAQIIAAIMPQRAELAEYFQMSLMEQGKVDDECERLGWDPAQLSVVQLMKVFKSKAQKPAAVVPGHDGPPVTDQDKRDMLSVFPQRTPDDNWFKYNVGAWRALKQFGDARTIKAAIEAAGAKMSQPAMKGGTCSTVGLALAMMQSQAAADALPPVDAAAGRARVLEEKRQVIKELTNILPKPAQAQIDQIADRLRVAAHSEGLDTLRDKVSGMVRAELLGQLPGLVETIKKIPNGSIKTGALEALADSEKQIRDELNLLRAKELIDKAKLRTGTP